MTDGATGHPSSQDSGVGAAGLQDEAQRLSAERQRLQADAVGGSLWTGIQTVVSLPLAIGANVVVAQSLGAVDYGTLAVYLAIYGIAVALLNAGVSDATVQWVATDNARGDREAVVTAVRRCSGYHVYVQAPLVGMLAALLLRDAGTLAMSVGAVAAWLTMVVGSSTVVMSGLGLNALAAQLSIVLTLAMQGTLIATALSSGMPGTVFAGRLAASLLGPALAVFFVPRPFRRALFQPLFPRRWPEGFLANALRTCAFGIVTTLVFSRSELFVFQAYGMAEAAGVFALAAGVGALITAPIDALLGPLLPATAGLLATSPERASAALLRGLRTSALLAGLVAAFGIPLLAPLLPSIYGSSFDGAQGPFVVLALVSCFQSVGNPVLAFLLAARSTSSLLRVSLAFAAVDLTVAAVSIPRLGVAGAVIASSIAQLGLLLVTARRVGRLLETPAAEQARALGFFVIGAGVAGSVLLVQHVLLDAAPATEALAGLAGSVLAVAVVSRLRPTTGLADGDIDVIARSLPAAVERVFLLTVRVLALRATSTAHR